MINRRDILDSVQHTIVNCDTKAAYLIAAIGIVFGFSIFSIDSILKTCGVIRILVYVFGSLYLLTFLTTLTLLVLVIIPRDKKTKDKSLDYIYHSEDLYRHLDDEKFEIFIDCEDKEALVDQIKECTRISHKKTILLRTASVVTIGFGAPLVVIVVLLIF